MAFLALAVKFIKDSIFMF